MAPVNDKEQATDKDRDSSGTSSSTTNNLTNGNAAATTTTSTSSTTATSSAASTAESTGSKTVSSTSFLAAAAAEERQQPGTVSSGSNPMLTAAGQAAEDLTASSVAAISGKLQQVRGYVAQTAAAMAGLERQADMSKIGQYNTLVKVMRELKTSEAKLAAHLTTLQAAASAGSAPTTTSAAPSEPAAPVEPVDAPNSQSIGQVSTRTVDAVDDVDRRTTSSTLSFADRLAAGMEEANQLTTRLRDNVARREDLVERYRATRERLSALKRQRRDIQQQERSLLLSQTSRESPYEDPIPGAASWSLEELDAGLADFRGLYDKVATLKGAYDLKVQALEVGDAAGRAEVTNKLEQLDTKRSQLIAVITQLRRLRADKMRQQGMDVDGDEGDSQATAATSSPTTATDSTGRVSSTSTTVGAVSTTVSSVSTAFSSVSTAVSSVSTSISPVSTSISTASVSVSSPTSVSTTSAPSTVVRSNSTSVTDFSDLLPADPVSTQRTDSRGGGSVSIGTLPALVSAANVDAPDDADEGVPGGVTESALSAVVTARAEMEAAGQELALRTQHLNNLKEELASMKRLLDVTQQRVADGAPPASEAVLSAEDGAGGADGAEGAEVEVAEEYITGVSGNVIHLSDTERHDPAVVAKFKELSAAKQRMAQMEEIMQCISASRASGLPLAEVLSGPQLRLLQQAEAEEDSTGVTSDRRTSSGVGVSEGDRNTPTNESAARLNARSGDDGEGHGDGEGDGGGEQDSWSAMLNKHTSTGHPVNYGGSDQSSKLAPDKQESWRSSSSTTAQQHQQRLSTIASLQEELRRKKNALEDLMRGMGKQSAFPPDNLSDNTSPPGGDRGDGAGLGLPRLSGADDVRQETIRPPSVPANSGLVLTGAGASGQSVRPKQNIGGAEQEPQPAEGTGSSQALVDALRQLRAVQGSINSLHDSLAASRSDQQQVLQQPLLQQQQQPVLQQQQPVLQQQQPVLQQQQPVLQQQQPVLQQQQPVLQQHHPLQLLQHQLPGQSIAATPQLSLNDPAAGYSLLSAAATAEGPTAATAAASGLQQCFTQLYLHSLEIQALNKQLQVRHQQQMIQLYQQQLLQQMYRSSYSPYLDPLMLPLPYQGLPPQSYFSFPSGSLSSGSLALPSGSMSLPSGSLGFQSGSLGFPPGSFGFPSSSLGVQSGSLGVQTGSLGPPSSAAPTSLPMVDATGFAVYSGLVNAPSTSAATVNSSGLLSVNPPQPPQY